MARTARNAPGGFVYHVLNRCVGRSKLFHSRKDHLAFQTCLIETLQVVPIRLLTYTVMSNHWHLLLEPEEDGQLARFMMRLTNRHVRRWLTAHKQVGTGHLYQGRFKSFPCQSDDHLLTVARYIDRNPRRANAAERAELWPWGALGQHQLPPEFRVPLAEFPIDRPADWLKFVHEPQTLAEEEAIRRCIRQSHPFGSEQWIRGNQKRLAWSPPKPRGRPRLERK
jgi:putative transposase